MMPLSLLFSFHVSEEASLSKLKIRVKTMVLVTAVIMGNNASFSIVLLPCIRRDFLEQAENKG